MNGKRSVAFSMPGGDVDKSYSGNPSADNPSLNRPASGRPIDMTHLSRQTMGDRALEQEVLALFIQQAAGVSRQLAGAKVHDRLLLAHGLKGSARGVGAFAIADCAANIERDPEDAQVWERLEALVETVRNFVAAIGR